MARASTVLGFVALISVLVATVIPLVMYFTNAPRGDWLENIILRVSTWVPIKVSLWPLHIELGIPWGERFLVVNESLESIEVLRLEIESGKLEVSKSSGTITIYAYAPSIEEAKHLVNIEQRGGELVVNAANSEIYVGLSNQLHKIELRALGGEAIIRDLSMNEASLEIAGSELSLINVSISRSLSVSVRGGEVEASIRAGRGSTLLLNTIGGNAKLSILLPLNASICIEKHGIGCSIDIYGPYSTDLSICGPRDVSLRIDCSGGSISIDIEKR